MRLLPFSYAYRNLGRSRVRLLSSLGGATLVVLLMLAAGGFVRGMQLTLTEPATLHENVMLIGAGSEESVERSQIDASVEGIIAASIPGILQREGVTYASPEIHNVLMVRTTRDDPTPRQAVMRGVKPVAALVHSAFELTDGRFPNPGSDELIAGSLAAARLGLPQSRLDIGQTIHFDNRDWTIVGRFAAPGTVMDAELWIPLSDLQIATKRSGTVSCLVVSLGTATFTDLDIFAKTRIDLELTAIKESDYYNALAAYFAPIRVMIIITAALIASGAILGGLNTMYAAFSSRVRETGMLQALGFTRSAIVVNLTQESVFAAACGSLIALAIAMVTFNGAAVRYSMGAFAITLDAPVVLTAILGGLAVGIVGAAPPAIRCLRLPIPQALKSH